MTAVSTPSASRIHAWMAARTPWQRRGLAFLAGTLATLGHAPFHIAPAFVLAVAILVWLLDGVAERGAPMKRAFALGWWFGFGHFTTGFYWLTSAFLVESDVWGPVPGVAAVLALAGGMALYWGLGAALAMPLWTRDWRRAPVFAVTILISEWVRGHLFGGFPWILPGYVWAPGGAFSQLASVVGIYGVSLVTLLVAALVSTIADRGAGAAARFAPMLAAALLVGLVWGWGTQRLAGAPIDPPGAQPVVRVADSGLSQNEKWTARPDQEWRVLSRYLAASGSSRDARASILVWPEGAIPVLNFFPLENPDFIDALGRGLGDRALIVGVTRRELRGSNIVYFNSASVIDGVSGTARLSQTYDKNHLVPGGEFIPLWGWIEPMVEPLRRFGINIAPLQRIGAGFEPGPPPARVIVPEADPATILICYESIFPGLVPRGAERPGWIVSATNDAWFGDLRWFTGPWQHFAAARYRSIEEGLPMARAASGGISAIIDSFGRAVASTQPGVLFAEAQLPPKLPETIFARWGFALLPLMVVVILGLRGVRLRVRARGPEDE